LLALANCLLLRGSIHIPSKNTSITYDQLSLLIADFLVTRPNDNSVLTLESALSILPTMTQGLDVDVAFDGINNFKGISARDSGELSVFNFAGVDLVHGWLADQGMKEEYEALQRAGSYEGAQERIVAGLEAETRAVGINDGKESSVSEEDHQAISDCEHCQILFGFHMLMSFYVASHGSSTLAGFLAEQLVTANLSGAVRAICFGTRICRRCESPA
jgi:hypothetical protein